MKVPQRQGPPGICAAFAKVSRPIRALTEGYAGDGSVHAVGTHGRTIRWSAPDWRRTELTCRWTTVPTKAGHLKRRAMRHRRWGQPLREVPQSVHEDHRGAAVPGTLRCLGGNGFQTIWDLSKPKPDHSPHSRKSPPLGARTPESWVPPVLLHCNFGGCSKSSAALLTNEQSEIPSHRVNLWGA